MSLGATGRGWELATYDLALTVRTPIHVGTGAPLREGYDYVVDQAPDGRTLRVIDVARALLDLDDKEIAQARDGRIASALTAERRRRLSLAAYRLPPDWRPGDVLHQHVRLPDGRPYLPGSSLKGALRTALLDDVVAAERRAPAIAPGRPERAGANVEALARRPAEALGGRPAADANRDVLRAVRVSDLLPDAREGGALDLFRVESRRLRPRPGERSDIPMLVEALRPGTVLRGTLTVERGGPLWAGLDGALGAALDDLVDRALWRHARRLVAFEREAAGGSTPLLEQIDRDSAAGARRWLNLGWGGGWAARTIAPALWEVDRGAWRQAAATAKRGPGPVPELFPATRRFVVRGNQSVRMGWATLEVTPRG
ncbi:MAG TPA: type III-A CRISPR-associated RAMP protein Csm5 [Chloroflexota bacterium]|nr:type III-A CRISPR-associated RAMP protein Csm5 [Chloroflexota bacterium]